MRIGTCATCNTNNDIIATTRGMVANYTQNQADTDMYTRSTTHPTAPTISVMTTNTTTIPNTNTDTAHTRQ